MYTGKYETDGSAAREWEMPIPDKQRIGTQSERQREEILRRKSRRSAARRNRERARTVGRLQVLFFSVCFIACAAFAAAYLDLNAQIKNSMNQIYVMQNRVADLRADNDELSKSLDASLDLEYVRDYAENELGMHYANEDQIIYYRISKSSFMDQYADIPD